MSRFGAWLGRMVEAVPSEELQGAHLHGPFWEVGHRGVDPAEFFRKLPTLVPEGCILVLEGGSPSPQLKAFLEQNAVAPEVKVARGTVWPREDLVHLPASAQVLSGIAEHADRCASPEICTHLSVLAAGRVVIEWHDAFSAPCWISKELPEEGVKAFCAELRTSFQSGAEA